MNGDDDDVIKNVPFFEKFIWTSIFLFLQYARLDDIQSQKTAGWNFVLGYFYLFIFFFKF